MKKAQGGYDIPVPLVFPADRLYAETLRISLVQRTIYTSAKGNIAPLAKLILGGKVVALFCIIRAAFGRVVIVSSGLVKSVTHIALAAGNIIGRCRQRPFLSEGLRIAQRAADVFGVAVRGVAHTAGVCSGSGREHRHFFARSAVCAISDIAADPDGTLFLAPQLTEGKIGIQIHPFIGTDPV